MISTDSPVYNCCDYKGILTDERRAQNRRYLVANGYINTWYDRRKT